jgi:glyceraldehyde 3-phosphate dehydrogenase
MNKVAIIGLGRMGRAILKIILETRELEPVAISDLAPIENLAYLLAYDTVYGRCGKAVKACDGALLVDGIRIPVFNKKDPAQLSWAKLWVPIVFECAGIFRQIEDVHNHIQAGAIHAILSAPSQSKEMATIVHDTRQGDRPRVYLCACCTTNCITPVFEIMARRVGVRKAVMTIIHAYTTLQAIVDGPSKRLRRGRAGASNLVPTTKVLPEFEGKFDGVAVPVPIPGGGDSTRREGGTAYDPRRRDQGGFLVGAWSSLPEYMTVPSNERSGNRCTN